MAKSRLEEIKEIRKEKVEELKKLGIKPYPSKVPGDPKDIDDARESEGKKVEIAGRIIGWRAHGNSIFADLKDETGEIQLFFQKKNLGEQFKPLKLFDIGDFLWVVGEVTKTKAGELTVDVENYKLLSKSIRPLPSTWHGLKDIEERYRQRYVDLLMNEGVREVFEKRAKIIKLLREYLDEHDFLEVKTPSLQPLYGGATARPFVTHHNALDIDLYLRISDELYLKRLIVGGFERVYEMGTDFRNEGIDRWHNPEFTMLEFYWAYRDYNDLMDFTEKMLASVVKDVCDGVKIRYGDQEIDFSNWKRITYKDAILNETKIDIDKLETLEDFKKAVKENGVSVDMKGVKDLADALDSLYKGHVRDTIVDPTFLTDHPYYMRPLAKRRSDDETKVESFQLIVAGAELINAYSELNDPQDQKERWKEDMRRAKEGAEEYQVIDEDYIGALEYGMPPTAGWGLGIDRFTAILTDQHSLKDTILFPTLRPEND
jgi:lysyl-tRNA synthetase class 2